MKHWMFTLMIGIIGCGIWIWLAYIGTNGLLSVGFVFVYATVFGLWQFTLGEKGYLQE